MMHELRVPPTSLHMPILGDQTARDLESAFTAEQPCEPVPECSTAATWYLIRSCGCRVVAYCDTHRQPWLSAPTGWEPYCRRCGATRITLRWEPIA